MAFRSISIAAILFVAVASDAWCQTLYRYVDKDGKVVYSDRAPTSGPFEKIEADANRNVLPRPSTVQGTSDQQMISVDKRLTQRIALRDKLRGELEAARANLAAARTALRDGQDPAEGEWQPTVSSPDNGGKPNSKGQVTGRGGKVVCAKTKSADGSERVVCPAVSVPGDAYFERIGMLELAVKAAEEALAKAETNYRRNAPD